MTPEEDLSFAHIWTQLMILVCYERQGHRGLSLKTQESLPLSRSGPLS